MDSNYLKDLIYNKRHREACDYLIDNIEQMLCDYVPSYHRNTFVSVSEVPQSVAGSVMIYRLLQEGKDVMPPEMAVMKFMDCYNNMKNGFEGK